MTRRLTALILILTLGPALAAAPGSRQARQAAAPPAGQTPVRRRAADIKDLAPAHRQFLTLVAYIISPKEREVFLELPDERDRDLFIEAFWKLRDPTPETPANE
ncbi:MAG: GWxTD domain-containing protein, partial [Acidobacteriota bacterium]